jgi:hypothetical protein
MRNNMAVGSDIESGTGGEPEIVVGGGSPIKVGIEAEPAVPITKAMPTTSPATTIYTVTGPASAVPVVVPEHSKVPPNAPTGGYHHSQVPPNAPPGGQWVSRKFIGPATRSTCITVSAISCLLCLVPCGYWAFVCPCDTELVYACQGRAYDEQGQFLGSI